MPGARGHTNEGPREIVGKVTITPKAKRQGERLQRSTMSRRTQILQGMGVSGGTSAPNARRNQIKAALGQGQPRGPGGRSELPGNTKPMPFPRVGPQGPRQNMTLAAPVKLGAQLQGRVQSGAIDQAQAQKTARQRLMLKKAFGSNWREDVYAGSGAKEVGDRGPFAMRQVAAERAKGLQRAKRKLY